MFLVFLIPSILNSQEIIDGMVTYNYTMEDGLPSNQVLYSMQDSKGYMWFGTGGGGAVRYDGANFEVFDVSNGLLSNEVYKIYEDHLGRIWFSNYSFQLCYWSHDTIYEYKYNDLIKEIDSPIAPKTLYGIHMDKNENLYFFFKNNKTIVIDRMGEITKLTSDEIESEIIFFEDGSTNLSYYSPKRPPSDGIKRNYPLRTQIMIENRGEFVNTIFDMPYSYGHQSGHIRLLPILINGMPNMVYYEEIISFNVNDSSCQAIKIFDEIGKHEIINVYFIDDQLWILTKSKGVFIGEVKGKNLTINKNIFNKYFTTTITHDLNGGLWISTHDNGILYIPRPYNQSISRSGKPYQNKKNLYVVEDDFYFYAPDPTTINVQKGHEIISIDLQIKAPNFISEIESSLSSPLVYVACGMTLCTISKLDLNKELTGYNHNNTNVAVSESGKVYVTGSRHIGEIKNNQYTKIEGGIPGRIFDISLKKNKPVLGTMKGYLELELSSDSQLFLGKSKREESVFLNAFVSSVESTEEGVWIAASGIGVGYYTDSLEFIISTEDGLSSTQINDLTEDGDTLWVSTNNGLNKLIFSDDLKLSKIECFNENTGLSSNLVAGVEVSDKRIFISTSTGYDIIDRNKMRGQNGITNLKISTLKSLKDNKEYTQNSTISYDENDLLIEFTALQFNSSGQHRFRYRLMPQEKTWKTSSGNEIEYYNLAPNKYSFQVEIQSNTGDWTTNDELSFIINPPFWKTWWFIAVMITIATLLLISLIRRREKKYREKIEFENELRSLKGKALRAQVNPHFIFNTLNSIQNFVLQGDFEKSNKFITSFSKLIRMILLQSDQDFITLDDEVKMLDKYLLIEQMRFGNTFDYNIIMDGKIDILSVSIPPMLIQPFVENAIWHGLLDKNKQGHIEISFCSEKSSFILCTVTDNGVGIEAAKKIKNESAKQRKSVGMSLTNNRLSGLSKNIENHLSVKEIKDAKGNIKGTRVEIIIPITEYKT